MITIKYYDRNGIELSNGDKIREVEINSIMQDEYGDNMPNGHYQHQVDTEVKWVNKIFDPQSSVASDGFIWLPGPMDFHTRESLCMAFNLTGSIGDDEFRECVLDYMISELKLDPKTDLEQLLDIINGFEIINCGGVR